MPRPNFLHHEASVKIPKAKDSTFFFSTLFAQFSSNLLYF